MTRQLNKMNSNDSNDNCSHYIPPLNFSPVVSTDVSLYRSGYPMPINYRFIKERLHLQTILYVGDKEDPSEEYIEFLSREGINFIPVHMDSCNDVNIQEQLDNILHIILNVDNYPILIHSNKGKHRVGVVVGIIRKLLQGWSIAGVYQEYGIFSGGMKGQTDLEFITMFKTNLIVNKEKLPGFVRM
ncbi:tyrosine-protein phosphatase-like protein Oca2p [Monosporozyma servazzii]